MIFLSSHFQHLGINDSSIWYYVQEFSYFLGNTFFMPSDILGKKTYYHLIFVSLLSILFVLPTQSHAQFLIKTITQEKSDYYVWITSLSIGPTDWVEMTQDEYEKVDRENIDNFVMGTTYRIAVATSEIYSSAYIEEITQGVEGCCMKLRSIKMLDLYDFSEKFAFIGEITGFKVIGWVSPHSFKFSMKGRSFTLKDVRKNPVRIDEIGGFDRDKVKRQQKRDLEKMKKILQQKLNQKGN